MKLKIKIKTTIYYDKNEMIFRVTVPHGRNFNVGKFHANIMNEADLTGISLKEWIIKYDVRRKP